ncbi:MAG: imidazole glycerol phosphate synthase subunit HisH [Kiritimatiellia bacterium]|jgi:glutamine amidotransferase|nr:imidazole glycerol phosphate synthase subunit HisH [Kiritimatiellia bacterium]MDP6847716.1 imidazole glycerol phosphate synthase subunit HisH [Kiritimatiellia bacterium]
MVAIIDYKAGNLTSVRLAFEALGVDATITDNPEDILAAERVVFPGVGAAGAAMVTLQELGLTDTIRAAVASGKPFLGICLGTQIIFEHSQEDGGVDGIGLVPGDVRLFQPSSPYDKVPQMGWNSVSQLKVHPLMEGIADESEFYFVHSYYPMPSDRDWIVGETDYADVTFSSMVAKGNLAATQFHPEKSGRIGLRLLENFCRWEPSESEAD